jgi:isoamylase
LGATWGEHGVNFALFSGHATRVEVCLYDATSGAETARYDLAARTGDVWHGLISVRPTGAGTLYAFCVHGPNDPHNGHRFDATVPLIDPYARALSMSLPLRSCAIDDEFDWQGDRPPTIPWRDSMIYELHVKGFTRLHPAVPEKWRGK